MATFGKTSATRLATCDERLQRVFNRVVQDFDCTVICGERGEKDQNAAFDSGASKLRYPHGKHNKPKGAVKAVDAMPFPVCWDNTPKNIEHVAMFAGYVLGVAAGMGIKLRWGHDWDGDMKPDIKGLVDRPHYEIVED